MAIIGIDLGTTNSLAVCYRNEKTEIIKNSLGDNYLPSVVSIDDNGEILVGRVAKERQLLATATSTFPALRVTTSPMLSTPAM